MDRSYIPLKRFNYKTNGKDNKIIKENMEGVITCKKPGQMMD